MCISASCSHLETLFNPGTLLFLFNIVRSSLESVCKLYQRLCCQNSGVTTTKPCATYKRKYLLFRKAALMIFTRPIYMGGDREVGRSQLAISWPWLSLVSHSSLGLPKCVLMVNGRGLIESVRFDRTWKHIGLLGSHAKKWQPSVPLHFSGPKQVTILVHIQGMGKWTPLL